MYTEESEDAIPEPPIRYRGSHLLEDTHCTATEILVKIKTLTDNKSTGLDDFLPNDIKTVLEEIAASTSGGLQPVIGSGGGLPIA